MKARCIPAGVPERAVATTKRMRTTLAATVPLANNPRHRRCEPHLWDDGRELLGWHTKANPTELATNDGLQLEFTVLVSPFAMCGTIILAVKVG